MKSLLEILLNVPLWSTLIVSMAGIVIVAIKNGRTLWDIYLEFRLLALGNQLVDMPQRKRKRVSRWSLLDLFWQILLLGFIGACLTVMTIKPGLPTRGEVVLLSMYSGEALILTLLLLLSFSMWKDERSKGTRPVTAKTG